MENTRYQINTLQPQMSNIMGCSQNVFTAAEIETIINFKQARVTETSTVDGNTNNRLRRSNNVWIDPNQSTQWIYERIRAVSADLNRRYFQYDLNMVEPLQLAWYADDQLGFYDRHLDTTFGTVSQAASRKLSISVQLTDPAEYDGGELRFHMGGDPIVAPKQQGTVIIFPSFIMHEVTPVTRGIRHSLVAWCHGPKFK